MSKSLKANAKATIPVVAFMNIDEIVSLRNYLLGSSFEESELFRHLTISAKLLSTLEGESQQVANVGKCKFCNRQVVWFGNKSYDAILPATKNNIASNVQFTKHLCDEYKKFKEAE
jgi:hypothetical protein